MSQDRKPTLADLISGVADLRDEGFPLESLPPRGSVEVVFNNGNAARVSCDEDEFKDALYQLRQAKSA